MMSRGDTTRSSATRHAATLDERDRAFGARAGGNRDLLVHLDVARHPRAHLIFDLRTLGRDGRFDLQADDGIRRNDQLVVELARRFGCDGSTLDGRVLQRLDGRRNG